jgi:oligo-alginate lyase
MKKIIVKVLCIFSVLYCTAQNHPNTFFTTADAKQIKANVATKGLLQQSYNTIKKDVDAFLGKDVDVPFPKDPAGGYTHDKHKSNYTLMFNSGVLYNITGDIKYAKLVKDMLLKYAILNPTLKNHPQATSTSPGRLFWQALNDANWMVYAGMAYDLVHNSLTATERKTIEIGAFKPEVDYFTNELKDWFNLLHNHAVWACAGVGIIGIASNNQHYVDMALKGTNKDSKSGFLAQMDYLFSPDGYYTEGPYYVRYAILPYMVFANALQNYNPSLKIFNYRNNILQKALETCLQQTNNNGSFYPLNDAIKEKDFTSNEIVTALSIAQKNYGNNKSFLYVAKQQNRVMLHPGGMQLANALAQPNNIPSFFPYKTIESKDGKNGTEGGIAILRSGEDKKLTSVIFKFASQGMGHGHFDRLNINVFDKGNEIISDYGSARYIGIEQKYGGRYLPENTKYAAQTIAHNTVAVDEMSHFNGISDIGEKSHPEKYFSDYTNPNQLAASAKEDKAYPGVTMHRSVYLLQLTNSKILLDLYAIKAAQKHQYDLAFPYNGQLIQTSFKYTPYTTSQEILGTKNGYQFLWKTAEATVTNNIAQVTFLNANSFYTVSSFIPDTTKIIFTKLGANDPNFNLRSDPSFIVRRNAADNLFFNVLEMHGNYDTVNEFSTNSYTQVKNLNVLLHNDNYTICTVQVGKEIITVMQANNNNNATKKNKVTIGNNTYEWQGVYKIMKQNIN